MAVDGTIVVGTVGRHYEGKLRGMNRRDQLDDIKRRCRSAVLRGLELVVYAKS